MKVESLREPLTRPDPPEEKSFRSHITLFVFISFLIPATGGLLFGYDIGSTSVVKLTLKENYPDVEDDSLVKGFFTSASLIGGILGAVVAFGAGDLLGRKRTLLVSSLCYALGSAIAAAGQNLPMIIAGKIVFGTGIGFAMHSAPVYISEIAPPPVRGFLVSCKEGLIVFGMVVGNFTGFVFSGDNGWRFIFTTGGVIAAAFGVGMLFLPETARWLVLRDYRKSGSVSEEATQALMRLRGVSSPQEVEDEINDVVESLKAAQQGSVADFLSAKRQLTVAVGLVVLQQVTGQPSVLYYTSELLKGALGDSIKETSIAACLVTTVKFFATMSSVFFVEKLGRKTLLLVGCFGMLLATGGLVGAFHEFGEDSNIVTILLLMVYVAFYQVGFGPMVWLLISEIFPTKVRSRAVATSVVCNFAVNLVMTFLYPVMQDGIGNDWTFTIYAVLLVVSLAFIAFIVPETKGKSLEEIEELF